MMIFIPDFISLPSTLSVLLAFVTTEHASTQKVVQPIPSFAAFTMDSVEIIFISCLKELSREFWKKKKVFDKYENKFLNENA